MRAKSNEWAATTRTNVKRVAYWAGGWVLTMAISAFGPKFLWDYNSTISILAVLVSTIVGVGMIQMNRKHINGLDEMHRKVTMEAMAFALGVGIVGGMSYSMLDAANVISFDAQISHLVVLMTVTYFIAFIVGIIRYK